MGLTKIELEQLNKKTDREILIEVLNEIKNIKKSLAEVQRDIVLYSPKK
jgi:hypothetical protein